METVVINTERNFIVDKAMKTEGRKLLGFIRKSVRTEEDAEDILQDVFYQLLESYNITDPIEKLTSWLFKVARNKIIDWYRKKKTDSMPAGKTQQEDDEELLSPGLEELLFDPSDNPHEIYTRSLIWEELENALDDLPEEQSSVFIMHELEGKSFNEIAEITGESINTLLSRKRYAVLYLRQQFNDLYNEMKNL
jgi:RNA polymerase sigma factor (sigma-70 family)